MRVLFQTQSPAQIVDFSRHSVTHLAVNHAEKVVRPVGQHSGTFIAERDTGLPRQQFTKAHDVVIRNIEHQHGVDTIVGFALANDNTKAFDDTLSAPAVDALQDFVFVTTDTAGKYREWPDEQG